MQKLAQKRGFPCRVKGKELSSGGLLSHGALKRRKIEVAVEVIDEGNGDMSAVKDSDGALTGVCTPCIGLRPQSPSTSH